MINRIHVKGFKSIWDANIPLGQVNVFIGTNGAGKSNLLEAIAALSSSLDGGIDYERLARRGARLSSPEIFRSSLKNKDRLKSFSIEAEFSDLIYSTSIFSVDKFTYHSESLSTTEKQKLVGRSNRGCRIFNSPISEKLDPTKSAITIYKAFNESDQAIDDIENYAIFNPSIPILRGVSPDNSNKAPLGLYGGRLAECLNECIKATKSSQTSKDDLQRFFRLFEWFKSIGASSQVDKQLISEFVSFGRNVVVFKDKFMKRNFDNLYAYDVSEGALYVLFVLLLLIHNESPNIFALDNVDSALNPGLVTELMNHIVEITNNNSRKQVFVTTHNPTTLDSIDLFNENHKLFVVKRADDGQTIFEQITPPPGITKEEWKSQSYGLKLSELWLSGSIGALPTKF